MFKHLR